MEDGTRNDRGAKQDPIRASFDASMAIDADSALLPIQAIEGVTSAAVTPTGGLLAGQIAWIDLLRGHYGDIVVRSRLAVVADPSSDALVSTAAGWTRLREVLSDAQYYQRHKAAFERRQLRDLAAHRLDLEALVPVVTGKVPLVVRAHRASDISAALALAREFGLELVIVGGAQAWKVAPTLARAKATVIVQPSENVPGTMDEIGARLDNAAILVRAGVAVGIARLGDAHNVRNLKQEAGIAIASGLDRDAALAAVTINIARAFGMDKEYGSIEPGKVANLVVWPADPFELSSFPTQVYIRGEAIPMTSRQTLLRDRYLQRKAKK
jgi:hypothetical protein